VLSLTAVLHPSALDARRGVVRLHPEAMAALGIAPWDAVLLEGTRSTGALAAHAPPGSAPGQLLCDELVLGNLAIRDGSPVNVGKAPELAARSVVLTGEPPVVAAVDPALLRTAMLGKVVTRGDNASLVPQDLAPAGGPDPATARRSLKARLGPAAGTVLLTVVEVDPPGPALVTMGTVVGWQGGASTTGSATCVVASAEVAPRLADLPGLETQAGQVREWLDLGFHHPDLLSRLGTSARMGVLVTGAAGSGKAALVQAVTAEVGARLVRVWGPQLAGLEVNAGAAQVRALLQPGAPTVLLVEDVEALVPRGGGGPLASTFLAELRTAIGVGRLAVVCTTSRPEAVDPDLRAPGMLDHELAVPLPDKPQRRRLLGSVTAPVPLASDVDLVVVAARTGCAGMVAILACGVGHAG